ncbi:MAG TPA: hypothetical protein VEW48_24610 [Thermoanaerobaculia bacterium]|nr:hypothetical protein [Thermoanaerobaculia bacterium]
MRLVRSLVFASILALPAGAALATPSSTMWTPMTLDIQPYGVLHWGVDNYFTAFRKADNGAGDFPTDAGLTVGILPFEKFQMEIGVDVLEPSNDPVFFNLKMGAPEGALFSGAPALEVGIFNAGTKQDVTDYNIIYGVIGKTFPAVGRFSVGPYIGNKKVLVDAQGKKENTGWMAAFDHGFMPFKDAEGNPLNRLVFAVDYASGDNALGGGGAGLYYYFTKNISLLTGPTWFNEEAINGKWKWSIQLDINVPSFAQ